MKRIDAHNHFWRYNPQEYGWIGPEMRRLQRDFMPEDLEKELTTNGLSGTIAVHARQKIEETEWLLQLSDQHPFIQGVVGWVPLVSRTLEEHLDRLQKHPKFRGVRHVIHDEIEDDFILRSDFNAGIRKLAPRGLVYDILIFERHLPQTLRFVDQHPAQRFVVDHAAKPLIRDGVLEPWRQQMRELAKREHVVCKVSGMVTEAHWETWQREDLLPYFETLLEAFGPGRLLYGSDWPVCLVASDYARWVSTVESLAEMLSESENAQLFGGTAAEVYQLPLL